MSTPGQPPYPGDGSQNQPYGSSGDPYAPGQSGGSGQPGYPQSYPTGQPYPGGAPAPGGYQQGGYPQGGYPQGGYPPPAYGGYPGGQGILEEPARPTTVTAAFWCWVLTAVAALASMFVVLTSPIWDQAVASGIRVSGQTNVDVNTVVTTSRVLIIAVAVIAIAVYLLFAFKMRDGRNWARIVLTVFGGLTLLSAIAPTTNSVTVNGEVFRANTGPTWVTAALALVGIILMFLAPSNKYFTDHKAFRMRSYG